MLKITMFQTPGVELDGKAVSFPFKRADALLYYMAVRRSATRQELISLLWESCDEAAGLKNLRNTLYTLKKALGGDFLLSPQKSLVVINSQWEMECDYDRFMDGQDLSAYRGPFLQGFAVKHAFSYEEWLCRTREKLHDHYLSRLADLARSAQAAGEGEQAARWAVEYLREDPLDEEMSSFLMARYRESQKYAKAAQVYQRLKKGLSDELGVDPMEQITLLYYEIMNQWNGVSGAVPPPGLPGRETASAALRAALESFREGTGRRCSQLLTGEAGAGKSVLVDQFLRWSEVDGLLVLRCGCLRSEARLPLASWDRLLLTLMEFIREEDIPLPVHTRARLAQDFSFLGTPDEERTPPRPLRRADLALEDAILTAVAAAARRKKVLLVLEDIQWMDPESLRLTDALLRRLEGGGLMAVLTSREDLEPEAREMVRRAEEDGLLRRSLLSPLTAEQTGELLRRELGEEASRELAERFHRETGGNLHLLMEVIYAYRRGADVGEALRDILRDRLSGLGESALCVARFISLFNEGVSYAMLLELMDRDDRRLAEGLKELTTQSIVEEYRGGEGEDSCRFLHPRIGEMIYSGMAFSDRRAMHRRVAALLSETESLPTGAACRRVSRHFQLGEDSLRAIEWQVRALDLESARRCVPFTVSGGEEPLSVGPSELEQEANQALRILSAQRRNGRDLGTLLELERTLTLVRGRLALFRGDTAEGENLLGSLSTAGDGRDTHRMVQACYLLAVSALYRQSANIAERYTVTGARLLERSGDLIGQAQFQRLRGCCFTLRGAYDKSRYYLMEAIDALERQPPSAGVRLQLAAAYCDYGQVYRQRQDYAEACTYYKKALDLLEEKPWPGAVWVYVHYGRTAFALEDHARARELFAKGYETAKRSDELWGRTAAAAFTAYYQAQDGDYAQAAKSLADAQSCDRRMGAPLEGVILAFVSMHLRRRLDQERRKDTPLEPLLTYPADSYARQGLRLLSGVPDIFEAEQLSRDLRDGINSREKYRAAELYSRRKHFMTE